MIIAGWLAKCASRVVTKQAVTGELKQPSGIALLEHVQLKEFNEERWELCLAEALKALKKSGADTMDARLSAPWELAIASKMKRETTSSSASGCTWASRGE